MFRLLGFKILRTREWVDCFGVPIERLQASPTTGTGSSAGSFSPPPADDPFWETSLRIYDPSDSFSSVPSYVPEEFDGETDEEP